jgi:hypothetical protein
MSAAFELLQARRWPAHLVQPTRQAVHALSATRIRYLEACPPAMQSEDIHLIENVVGVRPVAFDGVTDAVPAWLHAYQDQRLTSRWARRQCSAPQSDSALSSTP